MLESARFLTGENTREEKLVRPVKQEVDHEEAEEIVFESSISISKKPDDEHIDPAQESVPPLTTLRDKKRRFQCQKCLKCLSGLTSLKRHLTTHTDEKPFTCETCNKSFANSDQFRKHRVIHDADRRRYKCSSCDMTFLTQGGCNYHHANVHDGSPPADKVKRVTCEVCKKTLKGQAVLRKHMWIHKGVQRFACKFCGKKFTQDSNLCSHLKTHNPERKRYPCSFCNKCYLSRDGRAVHERSHTGEGLVSCPVCDAEFYCTASLKSHLRKHTGEKHLPCQFCEKRFTRKASYLIHLRVHNVDVPQVLDPEVLGTASKDSDVKKSCLDRSQLPHSNLPDASPWNGGGEIQNSKNQVTEATRSSFLTSSYSSVIQTLKKYACPLCGKLSLNKKNFQEHMWTHTGERPHKCRFCNKGFTHMGTRKQHERRIHGADKKHAQGFQEYCNVPRANGHTQNEKLSIDPCSDPDLNKPQHTCDICQRLFSSKSSLQTHLRTHTYEKPYICKICFKRFGVLDHLHRHEEIHVEDRKRHECSTCGKNFLTKHGLRDHMNIHTERKMYPCPVCDRKYISSSALKSHLLSHTGERKHTCETCHRGYRSKGEFLKHTCPPKPTFTGDKRRRYRCDICSKGFPQDYHLQNHMRSHTGEKPFLCQICGKGFSLKWNLKSHEKTHRVTRKIYNCTFCDQTFQHWKHLNTHRKTHPKVEVDNAQDGWTDERLIQDLCDVVEKEKLNRDEQEEPATHAVVELLTEKSDDPTHIDEKRV